MSTDENPNESEEPKKGQESGQGNVQSEKAKTARPWTPEEMRAARPYPLPEVDDEMDDDSTDPPSSSPDGST